MNRLRASQTILAACFLAIGTGNAADRHPGTAIVRVADYEYTIPIECKASSRPELGFSTEPSRITRERTGRTSGISLNVRPWKETTELVITLNRYVAWVSAQSSTGGVLNMTLNMSPASSVEAGVPETLTYERWSTGERPPGLDDVWFTADCNARDEAAPATRKIEEIAQ